MKLTVGVQLLTLVVSAVSTYSNSFKLIKVIRNLEPVCMRYSRVLHSSFPKPTGNPVKYHTYIAINAFMSE